MYVRTHQTVADMAYGTSTDVPMGCFGRQHDDGYLQDQRQDLRDIEDCAKTSHAGHGVPHICATLGRRR